MSRLRGIGRAIDLLLLAASIGLAYYGQHLFNERDWTLAVVAMGLAMILFACALRGVRVEEPVTMPRPARPVSSWRRWVSGILIALSLACSAGMLWQFRTSAPTSTGWLLYLASMAWFGAGFAALEWTPGRRWASRQWAWIRDHRWELVVLFALVAVGGFVRIYGLDVFPYGIWYDESDNGVWARDILTNSAYRPLYVGSTNLPAHFLYLIALSFKWFGVSAGSLRLVTALFGTALIVVMWLLGREVGGKWVGLLAAALVATSHWAINFSRLGMHGITTPFFAALTIYWLIRGLRTGSRTSAVCGGLTLGFGLCLYAPFRLFPGVVIVFWLGKLICERGFLKKGWMHVSIYVLASVIAFAPVGQYALTHQTEFFGRTKQTSVFAGKDREQGIVALKSNIRAHLLMFNYQGDRNGRHNLPGEPMLDPIVGPLLPLGVAFALARLHRPRQLLLLAWLGVMLSAGIFSLDFEAPQSLRSIGAIPAVFLLIAQVVPPVVRQPLALFGRQSGRWGRPVAVGLIGAGIIAGIGYSAWLNYDVYFLQQPRDPGVFHGYNAREALTGRTIVAEGDRYRFYSIYVGHPTIRFLAPGAPGHLSFRAIDDLPVRGFVDRDVMYIMEPEFAPPADLFSQWYPLGNLTWVHDPTGAPMLFTFEVSQDEVNESQGLILRLYRAEDHAQTAPLSETAVGRLGIHWDELDSAEDIRGEWTGQVFAPFSGAYVWHLESTATAALVLDGKPIQLPDGGVADEPRVLVKGWHSIRLVADASAGGEVQVDWTLPDGRRESITREALNTHSALENGLYGYYYQNHDWNGVPAFGRVDWQVDFRWHMQPLPTPFSVAWFGGLKVDQAGTYALAVNSNAGASLELNGVMLIDLMAPPHGYREISLTLEPGIYPLHARYHEAGGYSLMRLQWRTPDGNFEAIPAANLIAAATESEMPLPSDLLTLPIVAPQPPAPAPALDDVPEVQARLISTFGGEGRLQNPRFITVGPDGRVYVSDAGKQAIVVFDAQGQLIDTWGKGKLRDPADLAVGADNTLYVLDAGASQVVHFNARGKVSAELGAGVGLYGPRGLALSHDGNLVIADTGSNRVLVLSNDGSVQNVFGSQGRGPGQFDQPIDVAISPDGHILVADTLLNKRVQVFDGNGGLLLQWLAPWTSDFVVPAMGVASDGRVFMADADRGRIWEYAADGTEVVWWGADGLSRPVGLALDAMDRIYVLDEGSNQVYLFSR